MRFCLKEAPMKDPAAARHHFTGGHKRSWIDQLIQHPIKTLKASYEAVRFSPPDDDDDDTVFEASVGVWFYDKCSHEDDCKDCRTVTLSQYVRMQRAEKERDALREENRKLHMIRILGGRERHKLQEQVKLLGKEKEELAASLALQEGERARLSVELEGAQRALQEQTEAMEGQRRDLQMQLQCLEEEKHYWCKRREREAAELAVYRTEIQHQRMNLVQDQRTWLTQRGTLTRRMAFLQANCNRLEALAAGADRTDAAGEERVAAACRAAEAQAGDLQEMCQALDRTVSPPRCEAPAAVTAAPAAALPWEPLQQGPMDRELTPVRELGAGSYGVVTLVRDDTDKEFALKRVVSKGGYDGRQEVGMMQAVGEHPNIVCLLEAVAEPGQVQLLLEYCPGGTILDRLEKGRGPLSECDVATVACGVAQALEFMHGKGVVHIDLKGDNVFLVCDVKLGDFGMAEFAGCPRSGGFDGAYMPPEALRLQRPGSSSHDLWQLGGLLCVLLTGHLPFRSMRDVLWYSRADIGLWGGIDARAAALVNRLLSPDPARRPTAAQVLDDPWVKSYVSQ
eukprot:jgi/Mesen1/4565/ME000232S03829